MNPSIRQFADSSLLSFTVMLILALDTTTRAGSCALARDGRLIREVASDPGTSPAQHLPGDLVTLIESERLALDAIDVFAVATGPGSFTGLRVGIATLQGLAFAMQKPLIGVSGLDALAAVAERLTGSRRGLVTRSSAAEGLSPWPRVATWVDAWRGEVYAALYEGGREVEPPTVEHPAAILDRHRRHGGETFFIGDGAGTVATLIRDTLGPQAVVADPASPLLAGAIALLADRTARSGELPRPDAIRPLYVRRLDAERARDARAGL
jgi:tRNA threonylcarbamoyladenosine biosynthesis protein TsaB